MKTCARTALTLHSYTYYTLTFLVSPYNILHNSNNSCCRPPYFAQYSSHKPGVGEGGGRLQEGTLYHQPFCPKAVAVPVQIEYS